MTAAESLPNPSMHSTVTAEEGVFSITPPLELDISTAADFRTALGAALDNPDCQEVVVKVGELAFLDASGIGVIIRGCKYAEERRKTLVVENVGVNSERIGKIFRFAGMASCEDGTIAITERRES